MLLFSIATWCQSDEKTAAPSPASTATGRIVIDSVAANASNEIRNDVLTAQQAAENHDCERAEPLLTNIAAIVSQQENRESPAVVSLLRGHQKRGSKTSNDGIVDTLAISLQVLCRATLRPDCIILLKDAVGLVAPRAAFGQRIGIDGIAFHCIAERIAEVV